MRRFKTLEAWVHEALTDSDKWDPVKHEPKPCMAIAAMHVPSFIGIGK
jgi:hypothetical protein